MGLLKRLRERRLNRELAAYRVELLDTHYHEVEHMYRRMRVWRHDWRNHIQTMKVLAADGDLAKLRDYLDTLDDELTRLDTPVRTGNTMADAILNSKMSLAAERGIDVRVNAHIPVKLDIPDLDLCSIIGNLFDNAIEASAGLPEGRRMIRVYMAMKGSMLYLSFTNTASEGKQPKVAGRFRTTKRTAGHGLGLAHVDEIVHRLDGWVDRNSEDGAFTTEILLPQG